MTNPNAPYLKQARPDEQDSHTILKKAGRVICIWTSAVPKALQDGWAVIGCKVDVSDALDLEKRLAIEQDLIVVSQDTLASF
jgi:hypothetical protein